MLLLKPECDALLLNTERCCASGPGSGTGRGDGIAEAGRAVGGAVSDGETGLFGDGEGSWRGSALVF